MTHGKSNVDLNSDSNTQGKQLNALQARSIGKFRNDGVTTQQSIRII